MNEIEYARSFLGAFKVKADEIIPSLCPFCNGGDHQDKDTFALNFENHTYNCRRGSCGQKGHFFGVAEIRRRIIQRADGIQTGKGL